MMRSLFLYLLLSVPLGLFAQGHFANFGDIRINPGAEVGFYGNLINDGTIIDQGTRVIMAGPNEQTIGGSSVSTFNNLEIDEVTGVMLQQTMHVSGLLTLSRGVLGTTASSVLMVDNAATVTGANDSSYVSGPMVKIGNQAFTFPVGKDGLYAPISIAAPSQTSDAFQAEYFADDVNSVHGASDRDTTLDHISRCEFWKVERTSGTADVGMTLTWDNRSCGVTELSDLRVAQWDGIKWKDRGNGGTMGNFSSGSISSADPVSDFGAFTLSSRSSQNPLPVELISFAGKCENGTVAFSWSTASETNNDYFAIEHSTDGFHWEAVGKIQGVGNSDAISNYNYSYSGNINRKSYFKLRQNDFNGTSTTFEVIEISDCSEDQALALTIFPNPSRGTVNLKLDNPNDRVTAMYVLNALGQSVYHVDGFQSTIEMSALPSGIYYLQVVFNSGTVSKKIVIEK